MPRPDPRPVTRGGAKGHPSTSPDRARRYTHWLVGGPSRNGKTTLVAALQNTDSTVAGLPVEGLFPVYLARTYLFPASQCRQILREYLTRPRYTNAERSQSARPIDFYFTPIEDVLDEAATANRHQIGMIGRALDVFARDHGRRGWAVCDLHPELRYRTFRKLIPGLRLAVILRDPRESLCAMLYWRHFPKRAPSDRRLLRYGLLVWCLSAQTALALRACYPDDVEIISFNRLVGGDSETLERIANRFGVTPSALRQSLPESPHFLRNDRNAHLSPAGNYETLFSAEEVALIEGVAGPLMDCLGIKLPQKPGLMSHRAFRWLSVVVLHLGKVAPAGTKQLLDFIYFPGQYVRRRFGVLKTLFRENLIGLCLTVGVLARQRT